MEVFIVTINGKMPDKVYCSLLEACETHNLGYQAAIRDGKRCWQDADGNVTAIHSATLERIKGRGGNRIKGVSISAGSVSKGMSEDAIEGY